MNKKSEKKEEHPDCYLERLVVHGGHVQAHGGRGGEASRARRALEVDSLLVEQQRAFGLKGARAVEARHLRGRRRALGLAAHDELKQL